jgi:hypothetical protein
MTLKATQFQIGKQRDMIGSFWALQICRTWRGYLNRCNIYKKAGFYGPEYVVKKCAG